VFVQFKVNTSGIDMATASKMEIEAEVDTFGRIFKAWKRQQILFQVVVIIISRRA
jgi:hypothetical protein